MLMRKLKSAIKRGVRAAVGNNKIGCRLEYFSGHIYFNNDNEYSCFAQEAIERLIKNYEFDSVLDIGCGEGIHSDIFLKAGKNVTAIDYGKSYYFSKMKSEPGFSCIVDDFMTHDFGDEKFDCVWCSHVLEHQLNTQDFLKKCVSLVSTEGGTSYHCSAI